MCRERILGGKAYCKCYSSKLKYVYLSDYRWGACSLGLNMKISIISITPARILDSKEDGLIYKPLNTQ